MKSYVMFFIIFLMVFINSCIIKKETTKEYYLWCDGEWVQIDEDPKADNEVNNDSDTKIDSDLDKIIENDVEFTDTENEADLDYFDDFAEPDEDKEISRDFDYLEVPDEEICDFPCKYLFAKYDNKLCQESGGKKIRLYVTSKDCRCQTRVLFNAELQNYYFFGYYYPLHSDDNEDVVDLGTYEMELVITISGEKQIFICE